MSYQPKVYREQGGDTMVVASGGVVNVESGGAIKAAGTQAAHIADVSVSGTYATDDTPIETAINAIIAVLEGAGLTATS